MYAIFFDAFEDGSRYVCRVIFPLDCVEKINASALYTTLFCDYCARRYHFFPYIKLLEIDYPGNCIFLLLSSIQPFVSIML